MSQPSKVSLLLPLATSLLFFGFTEGSCGGLAVAPQPLTRPTPTACEDLDEAACTARADCRADYSHEGMCACPACEPGAGCPPCECNETETFLGCVTPGPCEGLDEAACNAAPGCEAQYALPPCVAQCDSDDECDVFICPDEPVYVGCTEPVQCGPVCDIWCEFGHAIDENGCELCACNPPPPVCGPVCDIWCEFGNVIDENGCELCACNPPPGPTCTSDAECPNGFCDVPPHCGFCGDENGPDCPEYVGMCVFPSCDDGQPVLCDALPPECGPGQVAAARNGCWACVDARTCN